MEGPGVHLIADELAPFIGQRVTDVAGTTDEPIELVVGQEITDVRAVKKRIFVDAGDVHLIFHLLLYGSYRVNDARDAAEDLRVKCTEDTLNLYSCSIDVVTSDDPTLVDYDRPAQDVLSDEFDHESALETLATTDRMVADVLLDQSVFGGVGNRIKNEVLWHTQVHPKTPTTDLDTATRAAIVEEAVRWAAHWYQCKQSAEPLDTQAYTREECARCETPLEKAKLGTRSRVTYWCPTCQSA